MKSVRLLNSIRMRLRQSLVRLTADGWGHALLGGGQGSITAMQGLLDASSTLLGAGGKALEPGLSVIIFSKDRPMQLAALLESMSIHLSGRLEIHVIYASSSELSETCYRMLVSETQTSQINFIRESEFQPTLVKALLSVSFDRTMFLVDDIIFKSHIDTDQLKDIDLSRFVPSIRLGRNINWSYAHQCHVPTPNLEAITLGDLTLFTWPWNSIKAYADWAYPLSVDGNIFSTAELIAMSCAVKFRNPNSFEHALQAFLPIFAARHGLCFDTSRIVNIPANRVQQDYLNRCGEQSSDDLLDLWQQGLRIDVRFFESITNHAVHEEHEFPLLHPQEKISPE